MLRDSDGEEAVQARVDVKLGVKTSQVQSRALCCDGRLGSGSVAGQTLRTSQKTKNIDQPVG